MFYRELCKVFNLHGEQRKLEVYTEFSSCFLIYVFRRYSICLVSLNQAQRLSS